MRSPSCGPSLRAHFDARAQLAAAHGRSGEASAICAQRVAQRQETERKAAGAIEVYQTLESTVGEAVQKIQKRLQEAIELLERVRDERQRAAQEENEKKIEQAVARTRIEEATQDLEAKDHERGVAIAGLVAFAGTGNWRLRTAISLCWNPARGQLRARWNCPAH